MHLLPLINKARPPFRFVAASFATVWRSCFIRIRRGHVGSDSESTLPSFASGSQPAESLTMPSLLLPRADVDDVEYWEEQHILSDFEKPTTILGDQECVAFHMTLRRTHDDYITVDQAVSALEIKQHRVDSHPQGPTPDEMRSIIFLLSSEASIRNNIRPISCASLIAIPVSVSINCLHPSPRTYFFLEL